MPRLGRGSPAPMVMLTGERNIFSSRQAVNAEVWLRVLGRGCHWLFLKLPPSGETLRMVLSLDQSHYIAKLMSQMGYF